MKYILNLKSYVLFVFLCGGIVMFSQETNKEFEVNYTVMLGKELSHILKIPNQWNGDYYYVIGTVKNLTPKNMMIAISFHCRQDRTFNSSGYQHIGWIDGNNSAAKLFILPIGLQNHPPPANLNDIAYDVKVLMKK